MKTLRSLLLTIVALLLIVFLAINLRFSSLSDETHTVAHQFNITEDVAKADLALGERIFHVRNGCVDCHGEDLAGKLVVDDPAMGTIYGANITPFKLQDWSDEDIVRAIRYGVHPSGRSLRFMPSFEFTHLSRGDLAAVVKYIRSVPAVAKENHQNSFGPIAKTLSSLNKLPVIFPAKFINLAEGFQEKPSEEASYAFGEYLAASCKGCHGEEFRGGPIPGGAPDWPEATSLRLGSRLEWTEEAYQRFMTEGVSPSTGERPRLPMPVELLMQFNEVERKALWLYLSSLKE